MPSWLTRPGPDQMAAQLGDQGWGSARSLSEQNVPRQDATALHAQGKSSHAVGAGRPGQTRHHGDAEAVPDQACGGRVVDRLEGHVGRESGTRARTGQRHPVRVIGCTRDEDLVTQLRDFDPGTRSELMVMGNHEHKRVGGELSRAYSSRAAPRHDGVA